MIFLIGGKCRWLNLLQAFKLYRYNLS
ncbi:unnamed protein product [Spirodela intermedia]|uniref:Uncharacterized protein n=2 Tax=Spirodela intermedia TaxID=51605 RepID=A0A7I8IIX8_SPIIN|nr:unnamed protein product [Spirodela intermedia]CAA6657806.1 unnamed protein product [Spirodela intermedia]CAA7393927.1 unnamed protein product [Spirodela intermedia]